MACCRVEQSILERTQPSPNLTKTNHDYRQRGDHIRSDADNSLVCVHPEKCETHGVHYMTGTQQHLYHQCMDDLQAAVSALLAMHVQQSSCLCNRLVCAVWLTYDTNI